MPSIRDIKDSKLVKGGFSMGTSEGGDLRGCQGGICVVVREAAGVPYKTS